MGAHFIFLTFCICSAFLGTSSSTTLTFGQSGSFSVERELLGPGIQSGIWTAFREANLAGFLGSISLNLSSLDDQYNSTKTKENMVELYNQGVFGVLGQTSSTAALAALATLDSLGATKLPFIGPSSGSIHLRNFRENVIYLRAAFVDECGAIVRYLTSQQLTRISILFQNDTAGWDIHDGMVTALENAELALESTGIFDRYNLSTIDAAVADAYDGHHVQALLLVGSGPATARAIGTARRNYPRQNTYFFTTSYMDAHVFAESVISAGINISRIYSTQVLPPPKTASTEFIERYKKQYSMYYSGGEYDFESLEGYLIGRFVVEVIDRIRGDVTPDSFLSTIYRTRLFALDDLVLGPFANSTEVTCNQGARQVYMTALQPDGNYTLVPNFEYKWADTCLSSQSQSIKSVHLVWGQSAALTGERAEMGTEIRRGLLTAFAEANRKDSVHGHKFELMSLDDAYVPETALANAKDLVQNKKVMGLVGVTGTGPSTSIVDWLSTLGSAIPFVGPVTGAKELRLPFKRNVINVRASYIDEAGSIVEYLTNELITRIAVLYEKNGYGIAGLDAVRIAMNASGLIMEVVANFTFGDEGSAEAAIGMMVTQYNPGAIILVGNDKQVAHAIEHAANLNDVGANAKYFTFSTAGVEALQSELIALGALQIADVYVTQVVPLVTDTDSALAARFVSELAIFEPDAVPSVMSLEGYLIGRFVVSATSRINGDITPEAFLDSVYDSQLFVEDKIEIGAFLDESSSSSSDACNQGLKRVWMSQLEHNGTISSVPNSLYVWKGTCLSNSEDIHAPIVFGQSVPLTGPNKDLGINLRSGILAAFNRFNRLGGLDGHLVKLRTYDDAYDPQRAAKNAVDFINTKTIAMLGFAGTGPTAEAVNVSLPANVPMIAPYTGAQRFRHPCTKYLINMRASYYDEEAAIVSFLLDSKYELLRSNRSFAKISMLYQEASFDNYREGTVKALTYYKKELFSEGSYPRNTDLVEAGLGNITAAGNPDAIIVFGPIEPCIKFVTLAKQKLPRSTVFFVMSFAGATTFSAQAAAANLDVFDDSGRPTVYLSTVMPSPTDSSHPLAQEYMDELALDSPGTSPNYISFEGYAMGRFVTRALELVEGEPTSRSLIDSIYDKYIFDIKEYFLGPYTLTSTAASSRNRSNRTTTSEEVMTCTCSQGSHQVWLNFLNSNYNVSQINEFEFVFDTCGAVFQVFYNQEVGVALRGIMLAIAVLVIILVLACALLVILYRFSKTMVASSPVFLGIILLGGLLLAVSPFFAVQWTTEGSAGDSICMTWIWFLGLGFTLFFAPLAVKTYRVYRIFNNRVLSHVITLKDSDLMLYLAVPVVLELILLVVWTVVAPSRLLTVRIPDTVDQTIRLCTSLNGADQPFIIAQAVLFGLIAIVACFFAFRTRNIKYGAFKESTEILFAAYNLTFLSVILVPLHAGLTYYVIPSTIIRTIGVEFQVLVSVSALFGMKLYRIITHNEKMSTSTRHSGSSSRGPLSFSSTSGSSRSKTRSTTTATTTTTTTSSSSKSSGSTKSTTSTTSSSSSSSSSDSPKPGRKTESPVHPAVPPQPRPVPTHVKPGDPMKDSIMTEPSDIEPPPEETKKKSKKHKSKKQPKKNASLAAVTTPPTTAIEPETEISSDDESEEDENHTRMKKKQYGAGVKTEEIKQLTPKQSRK